MKKAENFSLLRETAGHLGGVVGASRDAVDRGWVAYPHQIGLSDVLASLELLDTMPREIIVLGVEPISLELGMEMTATVAARIPQLVAMAAGELTQRGYLLEALAVAEA